MNDFSSNVNSALWASFAWGFGGVLSTVNARKQFLLSHPEISLIPPNIYGLNVANNLVTVN